MTTASNTEIIEQAVAAHGADSRWEYVGERWGNVPAEYTLGEMAEMLEERESDGYTDAGLAFRRFGVRGDDRPRIVEDEDGTQNPVLILVSEAA